MTGTRLAFDHTPAGISVSKPSMTASVEDAVPPETPPAVSPHAGSPDRAAAAAADRTRTITVMIGGDVMLDRGVRALGQKYGYDPLFAEVGPLFGSADIAVVNLEGPITSNASKTLVNGKTTGDFAFTFDPSTSPVLKRAHVSAVSLANNHADNFGSLGVLQTEGYLADADVGCFGTPWNASNTEWATTTDSLTIAFLGYHEFQNGFKNVEADVKRLKAEGDFVIVMPHWGVEYASASDADMHAKAHELASDGADAVIGAHPHVVEDHEWIGHVPVFYSLGNLVFDQYFSGAVMKGNIVALHIAKTDAGAGLRSIDVYETSTALRKTVTVSAQPIYSEAAPD